LIDCFVVNNVVIARNDISLDQHKDAGTIYPIDDDDDDDDCLIWLGLQQD